MSNGKSENTFSQGSNRDNHEVCMQAVYLMLGAEAARNSKSNPAPESTGGHLCQAETMCEFALLMADFLVRPDVASADFPSVFNYEVTEEMGAWLMFDDGASHLEVQAELDVVFKKFMEQCTA